MHTSPPGHTAPPPQAPQPRPPDSWWKRLSTVGKLGVILGGLFVLGAGAAVTGSPEKEVAPPRAIAQPVAAPPAPSDGDLEVISGDPADEGKSWRAEEEEKEAEQSAPGATSIGDTLTLQGFEDVTMDVTLIEIDRALEVDEELHTGDYVGVRLTLKNTGEVAYNDSPSNGAALITADDKQLDSTLLFDDSDCSGAHAARIAPGDSRDVCIPFEREAGQELRLFQFALNSGFADQTGEWRLE